MITLKQTVRLTSQPLVAFSLLCILYITLIFTLPTNRVTMETYNLTPLGYRILYFALVLPSMATWFAAFLSYLKLGDYANSIRQTQEGGHFATLARGAKWLAWSLPVTAIAGITLNALSTNWPDLQDTTVIISNYVNLLLPLVAFSIIGMASRKLLADAKLNFTPSNSRFIMMLFVLAGVSYCLLTFRWFDLSDISSVDNPYFLPLWLTLLTISIPYLYVWFVGLLAAYEITLFGNNVKGILYRKALRYLAIGIVIVIACSIALQYITTAEPRLGRLILDERLLGILVIRLIRALGFVFIVLGAIKLKKIEEV